MAPHRCCVWHPLVLRLASPRSEGLPIWHPLAPPTMAPSLGVPTRTSGSGAARLRYARAPVHRHIPGDRLVRARQYRAAQRGGGGWCARRLRRASRGRQHSGGCWCRLRSLCPRATLRLASAPARGRMPIPCLRAIRSCRHAIARCLVAPFLLGRGPITEAPSEHTKAPSVADRGCVQSASVQRCVAARREKPGLAGSPGLRLTCASGDQPDARYPTPPRRRLATGPMRFGNSGSLLPCGQVSSSPSRYSCA